MRARVPLGDLVDFVSLGIFGIFSMRYIVKDCKKRQIEKDIIEETTRRNNAVIDKTNLALANNMLMFMVKMSMNGCEELPATHRARQRF